jgi:glycosyltransferase involved in cell wall biosynthesis
MKIVHLSYHYSPKKDPQQWIRGFEFFYGIWERLAAHHEIIFINFIDYKGKIKHNGIYHWFLKKSGYALRVPLGLHWVVRALKPDVVMVHGIMSPLQVYLLRLQMGNKVKIVLQHHAEQAFKNKLKKAVQRMADKGTDAYFFTGKDHALPWLKAGLISDARKVKEIMEVSSTFQPSDKSRARQELDMQYSPETKLYLWIGHLNANKNPVLAVRAFVRFVEETDANAILCMIFQSTALLDDIKALLADHPKAAGQVKLVGKVPHSDLAPWLSAGDFIISTSYYEGSGVAVCEGMSCGCIPILSDIPSFRFMTGGRCGVLFETGSEDALVGALKQSILMDMESEQQKTTQQYHKHLSASAIAARIQEELTAL